MQIVRVRLRSGFAFYVEERPTCFLSLSRGFAIDGYRGIEFFPRAVCDYRFVSGIGVSVAACGVCAFILLTLGSAMMLLGETIVQHASEEKCSARESDRETRDNGVLNTLGKCMKED